MGSTFSNIHVRKRLFLTQNEIAECLSAVLLDRGFTRSPRESSDISFAVFSLPSSGWFTICENAMLFDDNKSQLDLASLLSSKLKSDTLRISCFDSDYIFLNLLNPQKKLDAWASVGSSSGLGIQRRTGLTAWESNVSNIFTFRQALKKHYVFAEEVLGELSDELDLPYEQSFSMFDSLSATLQQYEITYLDFAMPLSHSSTEPPSLEHFTYSLTPCTSGQPMMVSCINRGGAGKGIEILILGRSIENYGITFTNVNLAHRNRYNHIDQTPIILEKRRMPDGSIGYYGSLKNFPIPAKVSPTLPQAVKFKKELEHQFCFLCVPQYSDSISVKIKIIVRPIHNPGGGVEWRC